jgi:hypothetical protein
MHIDPAVALNQSGIFRPRASWPTPISHKVASAVVLWVLAVGLIQRWHSESLPIWHDNRARQSVTFWLYSSLCCYAWGGCNLSRHCFITRCWSSCSIRSPKRSAWNYFNLSGYHLSGYLLSLYELLMYEGNFNLSKLSWQVRNVRSL